MKTDVWVRMAVGLGCPVVAVFLFRRELMMNPIMNDTRMITNGTTSLICSWFWSRDASLGGTRTTN